MCNKNINHHQNISLLNSHCKVPTRCVWSSSWPFSLPLTSCWNPGSPIIGGTLSYHRRIKYCHLLHTDEEETPWIEDQNTEFTFTASGTLYTNTIPPTYLYEMGEHQSHRLTTFIDAGLREFAGGVTLEVWGQLVQQQIGGTRWGLKNAARSHTANGIYIIIASHTCLRRDRS